MTPQPDPYALRAAEELVDRIHRPWTVENLAAIIARETRCAELREALQELSEWVERAIVPTYTDRKPMPANCAKALDKARALLT